MPENLVGVAEVADMLAVSRQRVHQLAAAEGFPEPVAVLKAGKIWERADVEGWARSQGRLRSAASPQ
ncbi:helix-turn-helix domain-containing protein [Nocardioides jishulii]|uniref:Helix-turn-helix domain-containing protein n=1 Tax=Nocardioides jishulii TaxID=2575440 RepID=A0A4U2YI46_9ACTN|nr:helix-turn-helix domain-containing protein [Nocardioides jishulii]TKI60756.1 helix-turn-helix domain-containing protein [Nocardioides jishulii]